MVQLNLVIDGNYLLYRAVFILHKLRTLYGDLETLLLNDYTNISNSYSFNAIYFISDSKVSWRKKLYTEYKGKRKKQEQIDWDFVFETFDNFKESIKSRHNCLTYQIDPFEGDDIIAHIVKKSNEEGMSNLIVSNDGDLHQLLNFSTSDGYINLLYNHKFQNEILYVPKDYTIFLKHIEETTEGDIFNLNDDIEFANYFDKITSKAKISEVIPEKSYFKKIVAGDSGDNILSVIKITPKTMGIGDAGSNKVYNMYKEKYPEDIDFDSNVFVDRLGYILSIYKKNTNEEWIKKVKENIIKSRLLTRLDSKYLPDGFNEILNENIKI
jgi:5'-3' exonuclease